MTGQPFDTPVLYLIFNRPAHTARSFAAIRERRPTRLFIAADGPRAHVQTDAARVAQCRALASAVDWPCEVQTLYRDENLGCRFAVSGGISWFFDHVDKGIILEDDCVPGPDFWPFCATLLERYADDPRVMCISGNNFLPTWPTTREMYYFSRYPHIWGWATWARAWVEYKFVPFTPTREQVRTTLSNVGMLNPLSRWWWSRTMARYLHPESSAWDYRWMYAMWMRQGLSITPLRNLVRNIGVGSEGTHTTTRMYVPGAKTLDLQRSVNSVPPVLRNKLADAVYDVAIITGRNLILHGTQKVASYVWRSR